MLYLQPGGYTVSAELQGFRKTSRENVEVRLGDRLELDFRLEVGGLEETITVGRHTPMLDTRTASQGQVIDEKRIEMMPLSDGNPFALTRLAAGTVYHGDLKFSRPFDNGGTSATTSNGAAGGNEFTLDGSPNMANGRRVAFMPPAGAVQEFKVETATFDAQQGHTAGATVNVTMKSGTNQFHGDGYYHYRDETLARTTSSSSAPAVRRTRSSTSATACTVGGPVDLGKFYNGRNKTFFFSAFEWLYDQFPEPGQFTVPTEAQRNGDFSALLPLGIQIFDPRGRRAGQRAGAPDGVPRQHHPGQPHQPVAREILKYYPLPNQAGQRAGAEQLHRQQPARRRLLLDELPRRPPVQQQQQDLRPLLA